jgi:hypothetical protein
MKITHIYICMKLHVNMCMKLERHKDSKKYLEGHTDSKRHYNNNYYNKEIWLSFNILRSIRTFRNITTCKMFIF